ncbi:MAG TPA: hypothetical protein VNN80_09015 [Polyangiaceae bacterium]|nr:hypothetical protein [Polyangiaceae bacterium]
MSRGVPSAPSTLLAQLRALGERSGSAIGGSYARAARAVLTRVEQIDDLNAERRYRARLKAARAERERSVLTSEPQPVSSQTK